MENPLYKLTRPEVEDYLKKNDIVPTRLSKVHIMPYA